MIMLLTSGTQEYKFITLWEKYHEHPAEPDQAREWTVWGIRTAEFRAKT
jgi:hypothetical protein